MVLADYDAFDNFLYESREYFKHEPIMRIRSEGVMGTYFDKTVVVLPIQEEIAAPSTPLFEIWPETQKILDELQVYGAVIRKPRRIGKTTALALRAIELVTEYGKHVNVVTPNEQTRDYFLRTIAFLTTHQQDRDAVRLAISVTRKPFRTREHLLLVDELDMCNVDGFHVIGAVASTR